MVMNTIQRFEKAYKAVEDAETKLMSKIGTLSRVTKELTGRNITAMLTGSGDIEFRLCSDDDCDDPDSFSIVEESEIIECIKDKNYEPFIHR